MNSREGAHRCLVGNVTDASPTPEGVSGSGGAEDEGEGLVAGGVIGGSYHISPLCFLLILPALTGTTHQISTMKESHMERHKKEEAAHLVFGAF